MKGGNKNGKFKMKALTKTEKESIGLTIIGIIMTIFGFIFYLMKFNMFDFIFIIGGLCLCVIGVNNLWNNFKLNR